MAISINAGFALGSASYLDVRQYLTKAEMLTINENIYPDHFLAQSSEDGSLWLFNKANEADAETGKFRPLSESVGQFTQMSTMPAPGAEELGNIYQFVGTTTGEFTKGCFYICEGDAENGYAWNNILTEPALSLNEITDPEHPDFIEGGLKTIVINQGDNKIGSFSIDKELVVTEGDVKTISVEKVDEEDPETWIYTIEGTDPAEIYTKANTEDAESDFYKYPLAASTFIVLGVQNQDYPIFIDAKKVVSDELGTVTEEITANVEVGGIAVGDKVLEGTDITELAKQLLVKYFPPTVKLTATPTNTVVEKGETVNVDLSAVVGKKTYDVTKVTFYEGVDIIKEVVDDVAAGGTFTHTVAEPITADTTFKAIATDGKKTAEATVKYVFVDPIWTGVAADGTIDITTLGKKIETKGTTPKKYTYTADNEYIIFAYPAEYGNLTSILDANSFENLDSFKKTSTTVGTTSYNIYYTTGKVTCSNFAYSFKF